MSSENTPPLSLLIAVAARNEAVALLPFEQYCTQGVRLSFTLLAGGSDCVGAVPFAVAMMKAAALQRFDFAISLGFCGARDQSLEIGENVLLTHDTFFDYGLMRPSGFIPLSDTPFPTPHGDPSGWLLATSPYLLPFVSPALPHRRGYTLSHPEAEGDVSSFGRPFPHSSVETMEGAAFAYVAAELAIPSLAIRTVSNYCAPGDSAQWNIPKAQRGVREAFAEAIKTVISYINWKK